MTTKLCALSALTVMILASGCHGVKPIKPDGKSIPDTAVCNKDEDAREKDLCEAINLADGYRRGYLKRAGLISGTREGLGYSVIAASTLALYYGASPQPMRTNAEGMMIASPDYAQRVRRLGAVGAGMYAFGQWGSPKARDLVYLDGARAMACAVLKAAPAIPAIKVKDDLKLKIDSVAVQRSVVVGLLAAKQYPAELEKAAQAAIDEASNLIDEATSLQIDVASAAIQLRARIDLINVAVRQRLVDDSPTFESLVALTASLPGISRGLNAALSPPTDSKKGLVAALEGENTLEAEVAKLTAVSKDLRSSLIPLKGVRAAVNSVEACAVGGGAAFTIAPTATNATLEVEKSYQVIVTDPIGHPSASITGGQTGSVELKPIELTGKDHQYRVTVTGKAATSNSTRPVLSIRSASGLSGADITLTVSGAAGQSGSGTDTCKSSKDCPADAAFVASPTNVLALQCLIDAVPDCKVGKETRTKLTEYRQKIGYPSGDHVNTRIIGDLKAIRSAIEGDPTKYACPTEKGKQAACPPAQ